MSEALHIGHVFYINLDQRPRSRPARARPPRGVPLAQHACLRHTPDAIALKASATSSHRDIPVIPHVASIFLSHRKVLDLASTSRSDDAFVMLEDDVQISPKLYSHPFPAPALVSPDWEMMLVSVRFRKPAPSGSTELLWQSKPFDHAVVTASQARRELIATGAHFCIVRDSATAASIVRRMDQATFIEDVDIWFMMNTECLFWHSDHVGTKSSLGSNHKDALDEERI